MSFFRALWVFFFIQHLLFLLGSFLKASVSDSFSATGSTKLKQQEDAVWDVCCHGEQAICSTTEQQNHSYWLRSRVTPFFIPSSTFWKMKLVILQAQQAFSGTVMLGWDGTILFGGCISVGCCKDTIMHQWEGLHCPIGTESRSITYWRLMLPLSRTYPELWLNILLYICTPHHICLSQLHEEEIHFQKTFLGRI